MILNLNQLRAFTMAAELKSVALAAQALMVTPPAVTMQIRQLEQTLGLRLVFRHSKSIALTEAGKTIFKKSRHIFRQVQQMEILVGDMTKDSSGILRIGCPQNLAKYMMPNLIKDFKKIYPDVKIVLDQGTSSDVVGNIQQHKNDIGIVRCGGDYKGLKVKPLIWEEVLLIASAQSTNLPALGVSVMQLSSIPLVMPKGGSATRDVVLSYLRKFGVTPLVTLESSSVELIKELVIEDQGAAFLGRSAVRAELENGRLKAIPISEGSPTIESGIAYLQRKYLSPASWAFVRFVEKPETVLPEPFHKSSSGERL